MMLLGDNRVFADVLAMRLREEPQVQGHSGRTVPEAIAAWASGPPTC